jgi:DNA-binding transcriptional MerR regulator
MLKKIFILGTLLSFLGGVVLAQNETLSDPGLTPDSPFYFLEIIVEKIGNFFTFGDKAKAERMLALAEERLAEAKKMIEEGKREHAQKAFKRYQAHLQECEKRLERMENKGERIDDVVEKVASVTEKHIAVLERVYERVPDQAKSAILHAMEVSLTGQEKALEALGKKNPETTLKLQLRIMDQRVKRIRVRTENKNILAAKASLQNYERGEKEIKSLLETARKEGVDVAELEALVLQKTAKHIEILWALYEKAPEQAKEAIKKAMVVSEIGRKNAVEALKEKGVLGGIPESVPIPWEVKKEVLQEKKVPKLEIPEKKKVEESKTEKVETSEELETEKPEIEIQQKPEIEKLETEIEKPEIEKPKGLK